MVIGRLKDVGASYLEGSGRCGALALAGRAGLSVFLVRQKRKGSKEESILIPCGYYRGSAGFDA